MDVRSFEELANAVGRGRRRNYRRMVPVSPVEHAGCIDLSPGSRRALAESERLFATALWTPLKFAVPPRLPILPYFFDRYRRRQDKALVARLRAQRNIQAS